MDACVLPSAVRPLIQIVGHITVVTLDLKLHVSQREQCAAGRQRSEADNFRIFNLYPGVVYISLKQKDSSPVR